MTIRVAAGKELAVILFDVALGDAAPLVQIGLANRFLRPPSAASTGKAGQPPVSNCVIREPSEATT